jgi:hypothetical protein
MKFSKCFKIHLALVVFTLLCPNVSWGLTEVIFDNFDDGNFDGWSVTNWKTGAPTEPPDVVASPEGYSLRGVGSGYYQEPGLNVGLTYPLVICNVSELKIEMRAKSGPEWPNDITTLLVSGSDVYYVTVSGEAHQYAQFAYAIGGEENLYPYSIDVTDWHDFAWTRDADGWWSLSIDNNVAWEDFYQNNQLTSFDRIGLGVLRNQSEIEWVRISVPEPAGPVGQWLFEEGPDGTTFLDSSGNGNHGTLSGDVFWSSDAPPCESWSIYSTSHNFDAIVPDNGDILDIIEDFTIAAWVKVVDLLEIVAKHHDHGDYDGSWRADVFRPYVIYAPDVVYGGDDNDDVVIQMGAFGSGGTYAYSDPYSVSIDSWMHIATTYDDASNTARFYINGEQAGVRTMNWQISDTVEPVTFGYEPNPSNPHATIGDDRIGSVAIYKRALSACEIAELMDECQPEVCWVEQAKLVAEDGATGDEFGDSVSISGDYAIVGAFYDDDKGSDSGSAYILRWDGTSWVQQQKLLASDGAIGDKFGHSVSISGDFAIVSSYYDDANAYNSGSAYIFQRDGMSWVQQQKLTASDGDAEDYFGLSVSINGNYAIVGAYGNDDAGSDSGSAYIFKWNGSSWVQEQKLTASDGDDYDEFGIKVSINGDYAIVGARQDEDKGALSGSAYIFKRDGTSWIQQQKLTASDGDAEDRFGHSVSLSSNLAIVGADYDEENGIHSGSAYIFRWDGSAWVEQAKLLASDGAAGDDFGLSVSISGDLAIVGAWSNDDDGSDSGSAYVFKWDGTSWVQQQKLTASDGDAEDRFGWSVSISGDLAIVGACQDDDNGSGSGSAYVFENVCKPPSIEVVIDIKPGSYPNAINLGSHGLIPVAIFSDVDFDATTVDPDTVELAGASVDVKVKGKSNKYMAHEEDVDGDGLIDLVVQVATANLDPDSLQDGWAVLTGETHDGEAIEGEDEITIVPPE